MPRLNSYKIQLIKFHFEQIYDGASNRSSLMETICGTIPPSTAESTSWALTLAYISYFWLFDETPTFVAWYRTFPRTDGKLNDLNNLK